MYGNGSATMTSVFSLENGKHLSDTLSSYGPLDWGMAIGIYFNYILNSLVIYTLETLGTTYYDFATLASFSTSLPRVFEEDTYDMTNADSNMFEITAAHIMAKIASFHHQTITRKTSANVPNTVTSEWFNFEVPESEESINYTTKRFIIYI